MYRGVLILFFNKLKEKLTKTREAFSKNVNNIFSAFVKVDEEMLEELEESLILADVGMETTEKIIDELRDRIKKERITEIEDARVALREVLMGIFEELDTNLLIKTKPSIVLVVGVNGVGKTTSIGKIAKKLSDKGNKVVAGAGDTFRAAAVEQLEIWTERANIEIVKGEENSDPAAVIFDTIKTAKESKADIIICDTAGRLHNKKNLMEELSKINRIIDRELPNSDKEVLLVLDATTGQNGVNQAKTFMEATGVTGIVLTKLDGTAKGGIVFAIANELRIPIKFIGVGESVEDLQEFNAKDFVEALV